MEPDAFADWAPDDQRPTVRFAVRLASEHDIDRCVELVGAIGAGDAAAWRATFTRTVRDGVDRALFVADTATEVVGYGRAVRTSPTEQPGSSAPSGWYLLGVVVNSNWRRRGIGQALTRERMRWIAERADLVYYFTHRDNRVSQVLHQRLGFVPVPGDWIPPGGVANDAQEQLLYVAKLNVR